MRRVQHFLFGQEWRDALPAISMKPFDVPGGSGLEGTGIRRFRPSADWEESLAQAGDAALGPALGKRRAPIRRSSDGRSGHQVSRTSSSSWPWRSWPQVRSRRSGARWAYGAGESHGRGVGFVH